MWPKELKAFYMKQMDDGTVAAADLELPGIGESKADAIIRYREQYGNFKSIEEK